MERIAQRRAGNKAREYIYIYIHEEDVSRGVGAREKERVVFGRPMFKIY